MIDLTAEDLLLLNDASRLLPDGARPSYSTWQRWATRGVRGVRLATLKVGGRRYTTARAVQEFAAQLTLVRGAENTRCPTLRQRQREIEAAEQEVGGDQPSDQTLDDR